MTLLGGVGRRFGTPGRVQRPVGQVPISALEPLTGYEVAYAAGPRGLRPVAEGVQVFPQQEYRGEVEPGLAIAPFKKGPIVALPMKPGYIGGPSLAYGSPIDPEGGGQVPYNAAKVPQSKKGERYRGFRQGVGERAQQQRQGELRGRPQRPDPLEAEANALLGGNPLANLDRYQRASQEFDDPALETGARQPRGTTEPAYMTLAVPYKEASGRWREPTPATQRNEPGSVAPYRLDPMADTGVFLDEIADGPIYPVSDRYDAQSLPLGRLIEELLNKHKTPVMGRSQLEAAWRNGEFVPVPKEQRSGSLIGYLRGKEVYEPTDPGPDGERIPKTAKRAVAIPNEWGGSDAKEVEEQIFRIGSPMSRDMDAVLAEMEALGTRDGGVRRPLADMIRTIALNPVQEIQRRPELAGGAILGKVDLERMAAAGRKFSDPHPTTGVMRVMRPDGGEALLVPEVVRKAGGVLTDQRTPRYLLVQDPAATLAQLSSRKTGVGNFLEPGVRRWLEGGTAQGWVNPDGLDVWTVLNDLREAAQSQGPGFANRMAGQMLPGDKAVVVQPWIPGMRGQLPTWQMGRKTQPMAGPAPVVTAANPDQLALPIQVESQYGRLMRELPAEAFVRPDADLIDAQGPHLGPALTTDYLREGADGVTGNRGYGFVATERPMPEAIQPFIHMAAQYTGGDMGAAEYIVDTAMRNLNGRPTAEGMAQQLGALMGRPVAVYKRGSAEPDRVFRQVPSEGEVAAVVTDFQRGPLEPRQQWITGVPSRSPELAAPLQPAPTRYQQYLADESIGRRKWAEWIASAGDYVPAQQLSLPL